MPYIVTTKRENLRHGEPGCVGVPNQVFEDVTRCAVATLGEARRRIGVELLVRMDRGAAYEAARQALIDLPESGGTVGPLPDGTVIEVERCGYFGRLYGESGLTGLATPQQVLDAFNARWTER